MGWIPASLRLSVRFPWRVNNMNARSIHKSLRLLWVMGVILTLGISLSGQSRPVSGSQGTRNSEKLESALTIQPGNGARSLGVIVQFTAPTPNATGAYRYSTENYSPEALEERTSIIAAAGGISAQHFQSIAASAAVVDSEALSRLANDPRVARISIDHPVQGSLYTTAAAIGADQVWQMGSGNRGITGRGVTVAMADSGVEETTDLDGQVVAEHSFSVAGTDDQYGHGTHIAGIIAGKGRASMPGSGFPERYRGVAPGSRLVSLKVLDGLGSGNTSDVLAALDWCIKNKDRYQIRVINLSLGHQPFESYKTDPLCQMVEACVRNGIVVVVAAGNYGKGADGTTVYGGITSPGNDPAAITVGAINCHGTITRRDDDVASYSSRGPTAIDGLIKPDLVAPGNKIILSRR